MVSFSFIQFEVLIKSWGRKKRVKMYIVTSNKAPMRCLSKYSCTCCAAIFKFTFSNTLTTNICRNNYVLSMLFTAISISQETLPRGLCAYSSMAPKGCGCLLDYSCPLHDWLVASKNLQEWGDSPSDRNLGCFVQGELFEYLVAEGVLWLCDQLFVSYIHRYSEEQC